MAKISKPKKKPDQEFVETWVQVRDFPDYWVSNLGSFSRLITSQKRMREVKPWRCHRYDRVLKDKNNTYMAVSLSVRGKVTKKLAHRVVAEAFIGHINRGLVVNHKNGIKSDNRACNLEITTESENKLHAARNGLMSNGTGHYKARFTKADIQFIRSQKYGGVTMRLAEKYGVSSSSISLVQNRKTYRHV